MKRIPFFNNPVLRGQLPTWRSRLVLIMIFGAFVALLARALYLQGMTTDFLREQGSRRYERTLVLSSTRGKILDRNGVVLASSMPAKAIWAIPDDAKDASAEQLSKLASLLDMSVDDMRGRLAIDRNFVYLKHQVPMDIAKQIQAMDIPGIHDQPETRRYYPEGPLLSDVVGYTNIDGHGQAGIELTLDSSLSGRPGSRRVIKDRLGRVVEDVRAATLPVDGKDLQLSIDSRIQYIVSTALAQAIASHQAKSGAAIVVDSRTGEILALVSLPSFDPNNREDLTGDALRNRAITDSFEPGSIMKPLTAALALNEGVINTRSMFDTGNGHYRFQGATISDVESGGNGILDVAGVLRMSSNIGMTLISQKLKAQDMWNNFTRLGFGMAPNIGLPGAAPGLLRPWERWRPIEQATMAYGYGISASLLQVVHAYTAFARDGDMVSLSILKRHDQPTTARVFTPEVATQVRAMLEAAAGPDGTRTSQVEGYRVAGKTGTARQIVDGHYSQKDYRGSFVGFAPVSNPRIVVGVTIESPTKGGYFGAQVSGPAFSQIVGNTLRLMGVQPDAPVSSTVVATLAGGKQ